MADGAPTLIAVAFDSASDAEAALKLVSDLAGTDGVSVHDAAVVVRTPDGRLELHQTHELSAGEGAVAGGSVGLIIGLLVGARSPERSSGSSAAGPGVSATPASPIDGSGNSGRI